MEVVFLPKIKGRTMATNQCCFCAAYIVDTSRWQVTVDQIDVSGCSSKDKKEYRNVCNECMSEVQKAISNLDMSKDAS